MRYQKDENTIWEDTGKVNVYNYPTQGRGTFSYCRKIYKQFKKGELRSELVEGEAYFLNNLSIEQTALCQILATAESALSSTLPIEKYLTIIK